MRLPVALLAAALAIASVGAADARPGAPTSRAAAPAVSGELRVPDRVYAGYLNVFEFASPVALSGAQVALQRRGRTSWLTVVKRPFRRTLELVAKLPAGRQRLRVRVETAGGSFELAERTVDVRRAGARSTSARDDGSYGARNPAPNSTLRLKVVKGGTALRDFRASLSAFCVGPTLSQNRIVIAYAVLGSARVAPDGSVTGLLETDSGARVLLTGRLRARRFVGEVSMEFSTCSGSRKLDVARR